MKNQTIMGVLAYLGPLVIIPFVMSKEDPFVKFHVKQGVVLAVIGIGLWVLSRMFFYSFYSFGPLLDLLQLGVLVLSIIGIINVVQNKEKEIPLLGSLAQYVKI